MALRVLPEIELSARRRELEASIVEAQAQIDQAERDIHDAEVELRLLDRLEAKLISTQRVSLLTGNGRMPASEDDDDDEEDDGTRGMTPTRAIMDLVQAKSGLTRDEIFATVAPRLNTRSNDKRTLVVNILRRLVTKYKKLEELNGRYYLAGQAPDPFEHLIPAPYDDEDDDLPF